MAFWSQWRYHDQIQVTSSLYHKNQIFKWNIGILHYRLAKLRKDATQCIFFWSFQTSPACILKLQIYDLLLACVRIRSKLKTQSQRDDELALRFRTKVILYKSCGELSNRDSPKLHKSYFFYMCKQIRSKVPILLCFVKPKQPSGNYYVTFYVLRILVLYVYLSSCRGRTT